MQFDGWQWVVMALTAPVAIWAAWPFHRAMVVNARHGAASMDTLVSIGVLAAFSWSVWAVVFTPAGDWGQSMDMAGSGGDVPHLYFEVAAAVVVALIGGRYLEARAKRRGGDALRSLVELGAREASVLGAGGVEHRVPIDRLVVGDRFVVRPGEKVATDGVVVEGASSIDASLVTGESVPVDVAVGDAVAGATVNAGGRLVVEATRVGADTQLAQMVRLVEQAQSGKAPIQRLADRVSAVFVPVVLVLALGTLVGWLAVTGDASRSFSAAVAVLIIACPCALGLATPMALLVGTGRGAQLGILIRGPEVLESTRTIDTVVLDKTGTVTTGTMRVTGVSSGSGSRRPDAPPSPAPWRRRASTRSDAPSRRRPARPQGSRCRPSTSSWRRPASASPAWSTATGWRSRRADADRLADVGGVRTGETVGRGRGRRRTGGCHHGGRRREAVVAGRGRPPAPARARADPAHRRQARPRPRPSPGPSGSSGSTPR